MRCETISACITELFEVYAALRRYALSKLFKLELAESIIVCDDRVLLVHSISISCFIIFFHFRYRPFYRVYKIVKKLCFL